MKGLGIRKIMRAARRLAMMFGPRAVILLYHRVAESELDPYRLVVKPQNFEEHLRVIRGNGNPIRLGELVRRLREGTMPERAVCVTFDDGYQDNLYTAKPLLERYGVPATVFMTTGTIGRRREFWWDELERVFLQPGRLPGRLQMDELHLDWDLDGSSDYTEDDAQRHRAWTIRGADGPNVARDPTPRHAVFRAIYHLVRPMNDAAQRRVLDCLLTWAGMAPAVRATHRALEPEEIVDLERGGLLDAGAHTVNHLALSTQPAEVQREEIRRSKADLEHLLGHAVKSFAYPYGLHSEEAVGAVHEAGFEYACACVSTVVRRNSDLFLLPRVDVFDWDGDEFSRHLKRWFGA